jgi:hypothetical protein
LIDYLAPFSPPITFVVLNDAMPAARWRVYGRCSRWERAGDCWIIERLVLAMAVLLVMASIAVTIMLNT